MNGKDRIFQRRLVLSRHKIDAVVNVITNYKTIFKINATAQHMEAVATKYCARPKAKEETRQKEMTTQVKKATGLMSYSLKGIRHRCPIFNN